MRSAPSLSRLLGPALAAAVAMAGLVTASAPTAHAADSLLGAPAVGTCHDATIEQAWDDMLAAAPVPCSEAHTLLTTGVVPVSELNNKTYRQASDACVRHTGRLVGTNLRRRALTLYDTFIFIPNGAQQQAGARWVSCHVAVWDTKGLNDLPQTLPRATSKPAASVARCSKRTKLVTCAERHTHRAAVAILVRAKGSDKAVEKQLYTQGARICQRKFGRTALWSTWRHTPTKAVIVCLKKTRK